MRYAHIADITMWDELIAANPDGGHILQSRAWGEFKSRHGWHPRHLVGETSDGPVAVLALARRFFPLGEMWYIPKGPGVASLSQMCELLATLPPKAAPFVVRCEPELPRETVLDGALPIVVAPIDIQINSSTVVVDLTATEEELLASFRPKTRYNIRLAEKKGVVVAPHPTSEATLDIMFRLMHTTQLRNDFILRSRDYFFDYWSAQAAAGDGQLFFASLGDEVLAGAFITRMGSKGWYKDGGSVRRHHEVMAPYALQWSIMKWLKEKGVASYDLVAVPPKDQLTEAHPLYGLWRFKSGFCSDITEYCGTLDVVLHPRRYALWTSLGERIASRVSLARGKGPIY